MNPLLQPVDTLKGIGNKTKGILAAENIHRICDVLQIFPKRYEKVNGITTIDTLRENDSAYICGVISSDVSLLRFGGKQMIQFTIKDQTGNIRVTFFNQPFIRKAISKGDEIILKGKFVIKNNRRMFSNPKIIKKDDYHEMSKRELHAVYKQIRGIKTNQLIKYIDQAIGYCNEYLSDYLSYEERENLHLAEIRYAYEKIHHPDDEKVLEIARKRLAFDEFFYFQLAMRNLKDTIHKEKNHFHMEATRKTKNFIEELPFQLTSGQQSTLEQIYEDVRSDKTMTRMIQGDVGSGKTIVATIILLETALHGYQGVFMAPTEVLAKQHFHQLHNLFSVYGIKVDLLSGSVTKKNKRLLKEKIENGESQIIIGTHALLEDDVVFQNLALVITDEQHRFGVMQRDTLVSKGRHPHTIVMSATPIPRSLSLILYGDIDISLIKDMPAGRKPIKTILVNSSYRERMYNFLVQEVRKGRNIYIVCPMVEESETLELENVMTYTEKLRQELPDDIQIGTLHGKMTPKEKNRIMEEFISYSTQVLVSTTVIEVGVNVPNASIMVIENAERFGLAQLHQLRGRVGRGEYESHCILVSDTKGKTTKEKLRFLKENNDGFKLAEYDLKTRGPGDVFGTRQHGITGFKLADLYEDMDLLKEANALAHKRMMDKVLKENLALFYYVSSHSIGI